MTLVGRTAKVVHNGERVIDQQAIPGVTGGALDSDEGRPGRSCCRATTGRWSSAASR